MSHTLRNNASTTEQSIELFTPNKNLFTQDLPRIKMPKIPPKTKMGEPDFESLTTAEKMNDSKYRSLLYRMYPNESICVCENSSKEKISNLSNCPGGCFTKCCSITRKTSKKKISTNKLFNYSPNSRRLRGGGEGVDNLKYEYYNDERNQIRLQGGGEQAANYCNKNKYFDTTKYCWHDMPRIQDEKKNCSCCPNMKILNSVVQRKNFEKLIKKPCLEIESILNKFEETKQFVESIGKVPGLSGLGLMELSERPFFGRNTGKNGTNMKESRIPNIASHPMYQVTNLNCTSVCNKKLASSQMMTGKLGVVREATPVLPDLDSFFVPGSKVKKKDEKSEKKEGESSSIVVEDTSPCGDPKCKSRKKKISIDIEASGILKGSNSKILNEGNKYNRKKNRFTFGSSRNQFISKASVKMTNKIDKFVYSTGDTYPGLSSGHKSCNEPFPRVPPNMGWLWHPEDTLSGLKPRIGWKPGAINSRLRQVFREVKASFWPGRRPKSSQPRRKKGSTTRRNRSLSSVRKELTKKQEFTEEEWKEPPPTLHIHRKDGVYYVTMYPIKDDKMDTEKLDESIKPLQFKILKNRDDVSDITSSTASDMEIEFSPPAAVNRYRKMPDVIHVETQVKQQEIIDAFKSLETKNVKKSKKREN